jgi:hypothetical protein
MFKYGKPYSFWAKIGVILTATPPTKGLATELFSHVTKDDSWSDWSDQSFNYLHPGCDHIARFNQCVDQPVFLSFKLAF